LAAAECHHRFTPSNANQKWAGEKAESKPTNPSAKEANDGMDFHLPSPLEGEHPCGNRSVNDKQKEPRLERVVMVAAKDKEEAQRNNNGDQILHIGRQRPISAQGHACNR
jgi:hypothetical protein